MTYLDFIPIVTLVRNTANRTRRTCRFSHQKTDFHVSCKLQKFEIQSFSWAILSFGPDKFVPLERHVRSNESV